MADNQVTAKELLDAELIIAVLVQYYHNSQRITFAAKNLETVLDNAARKKGGRWEVFQKHHQYFFSKVFMECMTDLVSGSGLIREGSTTTHQIPPHTRGPYGKAVLDSMPPELKVDVQKIAAELHVLSLQV